MKEETISHEEDMFALDTLVQTVETNLTRDGFLAPVVIMLCKEGVKILDATKYLGSEEEKDILIDALTQLIPEYETYKIFFISECWAYSAPQEMPLETIKEIASEGKHRYHFERTEIYQILTITKDSLKMFSKTFERDEKDNDKVISFGVEVSTEDVVLDRFQPLQDCLCRMA